MFNIASIIALFTMFVGMEIEAVGAAQNIPELVKFLAPIVAGLLAKIIDKHYERQEAKRKRKESEV